MNDIRFHTKQREQHRLSQNSRVVVLGEHDGKPVDFYGVLIDIIELYYMGWRHIYLFKCDWFDVDNLKRGIHVGNH